MKFIIKKNSSKLTTIAVGFQAGAALESQYSHKNGVAHYLEHFMFKGTEKRNSFEISRDTAFLGGDSNAFTSNETVVYFMTIPVEHFESGVEIISDMVLNPIFPESEFEKEKQVILEEFTASRDHIGHLMHDAFREHFYTNYLANSVIGTEESINSIQLEDLKRFYGDFYKKDNMVISICSSNKPADVEAVLEKYFGKQDGVVNLPLAAEKTLVKKSKEIDVIRAELEQNQVLMAWPSFKRGSKRNYMASIVSTILGDGMDSRLFQEVREKANLVYGISAGQSPDRTSGNFSIEFSTRAQNVEKAKEIIQAEITKMVSTLVTDEELARAKNKITTGVYRSCESGESMAIRAIDRYLFDQKLFNASATTKKLAKITKEDVLETAKRIFSGKRIIVTAKKAA